MPWRDMHTFCHVVLQNVSEAHHFSRKWFASDIHSKSTFTVDVKLSENQNPSLWARAERMSTILGHVVSIDSLFGHWQKHNLSQWCEWKFIQLPEIQSTMTTSSKRLTLAPSTSKLCLASIETISRVELIYIFKWDWKQDVKTQKTSSQTQRE